MKKNTKSKIEQDKKDREWRELLDGKRLPINREEMLHQAFIHQNGYPQGQDEEE